MRVNVTFDDRRFSVALSRFSRETINRAASRALNRAITSARAEAVRSVQAEMPLKSAAIKARLRLSRATPAKLDATIRVPKDYDPSLALFRPTWRRGQPGGAIVRIGGGRVTVLGSFTARTRYGRLGVFRREGRSRTPLVWLRASDAGVPTLAAAFLRDRSVRAMERVAQRRFVETYERELAFRGARG